MNDSQDNNEKTLIAYGEVFHQLLQIPWMKDLIDTHFDIIQNIDHEAKEVALVVVEVPPDEVKKRIAERDKTKPKADAPRIIMPSADDVKILS